MTPLELLVALGVGGDCSGCFLFVKEEQSNSSISHAGT